MRDKATLLIVDDSTTARQMIRNYVNRFRRGWNIYESDSGEDALLMCKHVRPDFVTMDINMPGISGYEAAKQILSEAPVTRIVFVTAVMQDTARRAAKEAGMGFVPKPITDQGIERAIEFFELEAEDAR